MKQTWKRSLCAMLVFCMVLALFPAGVLTVHAASGTQEGKILSLDFENQAVGTKATDAGWKITTQTASEAYTAEIRELDENGKKNKVLALEMDTTAAQAADHVILSYPLGSEYDKVSMSYKIRFSDGKKGIAFFPSLGRDTSQLVCLSMNTAAPFSYQPETGGWAKLQLTEDGETFTDFGAYAANQWYTIRTDYVHTADGWSAKVYVDGKLTNATVKKDVSWMKAAKDVVAFLTSYKGASGTLYLDDVEVFLPSSEEPAENDVLNLDFEKTAVGTAATDAGWTMNPAATETVNAKIIDLQGNHVLALRVDEKPSSHEFLTYALENVPAAGYDKLTYSYNIAFSANANYLFMPSLGTKDSQLVCLNSDGTYTPDNKSWPKLKYAESGAEVGRYQNMTWYTVKTVYEKTADGVTASTYLNGQLTDAGMRNKLSKIDHVILMAMTYASKYGYTVYVDNIRITEGGHTPVSPAPLVADTLSFAEPSYTVAEGKWVEAPAALTIQSGYTYNAITYTSSTPAVAVVDASGTITGVSEGTAVITASAVCKNDSRIVLTAAATVSVSARSRNIYAQNFDELSSMDELLKEWTLYDATNGDARVELVQDPDGTGKVLSLTRDGKKSGAVDLTLKPEMFEQTGKAELTYRFKRTAWSTIYGPTLMASDGSRVPSLVFDVGDLFYQKVEEGNKRTSIHLSGIGSADWHTVKIVADKEQGKWYLYLDGAYVPCVDNDIIALAKGDFAKINLATLSSAATIPTIYFDDFVLRHAVNATAVSFDNAPSEIIAGVPTQLTLKFEPENTSITSADFSSSDETVATVDAFGRVTGLKDGTVTITAAPHCGLAAISTTLTVKVSDVQSVTVTPEALTLPVGGHQFLQAATVPEKATDGKLTFASSDETVADVDEWGEVTTISAGTATITVAVAENPAIHAEAAVTVTEPNVMATIYLAPNGTGDGSSTANAASITRAQELIAAAKRSGMTGNIEVLLADGYYRLNSTLTLDEASGGDGKFSVVWKAEEDAKPVIGSAYHLSGTQFTKYSGSGSKSIYVADVPAGTDSRQLFVNNVRATRARSEGGLTNSAFLMSGGTNVGYTCDNTELLSFAKPTDLELVFKEEWTQSRIHVASLVQNGEKVNLTLDQPGWRYILNKGSTKAKETGPVWIENALELLDEPGEWYLDTAANKLYYMPRPFEDMASAEFSIPTIDGELLTITGSGYEDNQMVQNIRFEGITFADTTWLRPNGECGHADIQNNHIREVGDVLQTAAVLVKRANGVHFEDCTFTRIGINALQMREAVQNCTIIGNHFYDISSSAVNVGLPQENANTSGSRMLKNFTISNNYIHNIGADYGSAAAISVSYAANVTSWHNEIFHVPYSGYHIGYGWNTRGANILKNNDIAYNFIHDYMGDGIYDGGAIYTLGNSNGDGYNLIHDNYAKNQMNRTGVLYADQGSTYWKFLHNVVDVSETTKWSGGWSPYWASISEYTEHIEYSGNYTTTDRYIYSNQVVFGEDGVTMGENPVYDPKNPPAEVKSIIAAAGLESAYTALRNGQIERISTNLPEEEIMLDEGETFAIQMSFSDGMDRDISGGRTVVAYGSSNEAVAAVSASGTITAVGGGTAKIRVYVVSNDVLTVLERAVVVGDALDTLTLQNVDGEICMSMASSGKTLIPIVTTQNGRVVTPEEINYGVSDVQIATVENGRLIPKHTGQTTLHVTATVSGKQIRAAFPVRITQTLEYQAISLSDLFAEANAGKWTKNDYGGSTWTLDPDKSLTAKWSGYATYVATKFSNYLLSFKLTIDNSTGGGAWPAIVLRAESDKSYVSADMVDGYMFELAQDGIAFDRFIDNLRYQIYGGIAESGKCTNIIKQGPKIQNSPWTLGEEHEIQMGAIADGDDVRLLLYVDGVEVINYLDLGANKAISEPGYFGLIGRGETFTLSSFSDAALAAQEVERKIRAIGTVALDSKPAIDAARSAYDALMSEEKALVRNYQTLKDAEAAYAALVAADNQAKADTVIALINAIRLPITKDSKTAIDAARSTYDALSDAQKALISAETLKKLTDAEEAYRRLIESDQPTPPSGVVAPAKPGSAAPSYSDVNRGDWYYDAVSFVVEKGLMNGTGTGMFTPNAATTRGMIVTILYRLEGEPAVAVNCPFSDVKSGAYYEKAITWAAANDIVGGYGAGKFGPDDTITREQFAAIIYRYAGKPAARGEVSMFTDAAQVSAWAADALRWAVGEGILSGVGGSRLDPNGQATRAQVAKMLMNYLK